MDLLLVTMISNHVQEAHQLQIGRGRQCFCFADAVHDKRLMAFLFGVHVNDQAGFSKLDAAQDNRTGTVDHKGKDRDTSTPVHVILALAKRPCDGNKKAGIDPASKFLYLPTICRS